MDNAPQVAGAKINSDSGPNAAPALATPHSGFWKWATSAEWILRCAALVAVVWFASSTARTLLNFGDTAPDTPKGQPTSAQGIAAIVGDKLEGSWEIAECPWSFAVRQVQASEVDAAISVPPNTFERKTGADNLPDVGECELLISLGAEHRQLAGRPVLRIAKDNLRALAWFEGQDQRAGLRTIRLAWPLEKLRWNVLEATRIDGDESPIPTTKLVAAPLPQEAQRLAVRKNSQGESLCEIISFETGQKGCLAWLETNGWNLTQQENAELHERWLATKLSASLQLIFLSGSTEPGAAVIMLLPVE